MRRIREVLRLRAELGPNLSAISAGAKLARSTVRAYLDRAAAAGLDAAAADGLSETALEVALYPPSSATDGRALPDWAEVDQELRRHKHVTRKLLWEQPVAGRRTSCRRRSIPAQAGCRHAVLDARVSQSWSSSILSVAPL